MFVSFLINKVGREAFHRLIRDYTRYGDLEGALRRGTGMNLADLEERWLSLSQAPRLLDTDHHERFGALVCCGARSSFTVTCGRDDRPNGA